MAWLAAGCGSGDNGTGGSGGGGAGGMGGGGGSGGQGGGVSFIERVDNTGCFDDQAGTAVPETLSATGCFSDVPSRTPVAALIPFTVNSQLWTDGAEKERYLVLPTADSTISVPLEDRVATGAWDLPDGTILIKTFLLPFDDDGTPQWRPVETRFLIQRDAETWDGYSYKWNDTFTDADLLENGETASYMIYDEESGSEVPHDHFFPSREECLRCHRSGVGMGLGLRIGQMNRTYAYEAGTANQLTAFAQAGIFAESLPSPSTLPAMPDPLGAGPVEDRARSYLHANCSHCHQPGGYNPIMDLRYDTPVNQMAAVCETASVPVESTVDPEVTLEKRIVRGSAVDSIVWERMGRRGVLGMPQIGSLIVDDEGRAVVEAWIDGMTPAGCD